MSKIRICQLITELRPAGAERCLFELARRLDRDRFDVRVIGLRGGPVAQWLRDACIQTAVLGVRGKWDVFKLSALTDLLRKWKIDLLHTHLFHADLAGRLAANAAPVPHLVHTTHVAEGRFRPWQYFWARFMADRCDRIVAVSDAAFDYHSSHSGLPHWRYRVIHNGINASAYHRDPALRTELRRQWGIAEDQLLLGYVGRLDYQKGIDVLVSAMSHLGARGKPMNLVIAGDGPRRSTVENFVNYGEGGSHTRWLGFVPEIRGVLSAADILLMPSRWEGFGMAAAEAMAAELPVIGTRVPGLAEVIDGTGVLIPPDDVVALTDAIEHLGADAELRKRLGRLGRDRVEKLFDIDANIAAHAALYEDVIRSKAPAFRPEPEPYL